MVGCLEGKKRISYKMNLSLPCLVTLRESAFIKVCLTCTHLKKARQEPARITPSATHKGFQHPQHKTPQHRKNHTARHRAGGESRCGAVGTLRPEWERGECCRWGQGGAGAGSGAGGGGAGDDVGGAAALLGASWRLWGRIRGACTLCSRHCGVFCCVNYLLSFWREGKW